MSNCQGDRGGGMGMRCSDLCVHAIPPLHGMQLSAMA
jgi:hypothetical protein